MRIIMINGSPKLGKSNSGVFINMLENMFAKQHEILRFVPAKNPVSDFTDMLQSDVIVIAFPLYIDAVPAPLFRMMQDMERAVSDSSKKDICVYAIANNGFFEGKQNHIALDIVKNWCLRAGLRYCQGIGVGSGEMQGSLDGVPLGHGPLKNLGGALETLARNIEAREIGENILFNPNFPRSAWHIPAKAHWTSKAKANGLKPGDLKRRIE